MSKPKTEAPQQAVAKPYEPTPQEKRAITTYFAAKDEKPRRPRATVSAKGGGNVIKLDHPEPAVASVLLATAMGTTDVDFQRELLRQVSDASASGSEADEGALNFMLAVIEGISPRDHVEAMLAAQMAAVHMATMTFARRLAHANNLPQQDSAERAFNKLARTFAMQMETLKRYRTGGEQTVTVQHVHVNDGGQAIVGNVRGVGTPEKPAATP
jgi:hypothetical protein